MAASWHWLGNIHLDSLVTPIQGTVEKMRINSVESLRLCRESRGATRWQFAPCWPAKFRLNKTLKLWRASGGRIYIEFISALLKFIIKC
jgi:hypothetical protein